MLLWCKITGSFSFCVLPLGAEPAELSWSCVYWAYLVLHWGCSKQTVTFYSRLKDCMTQRDEILFFQEKSPLLLVSVMSMVKEFLRYLKEGNSLPFKKVLLPTSGKKSDISFIIQCQKVGGCYQLVNSLKMSSVLILWFFEMLSHGSSQLS